METLAGLPLGPTTLPSGVSRDAVQVSYEWPGQEAKMECVYGGGVRLEQTDCVAEPGVLVYEMAVVSIYIRVVVRPRCPVQETDRRCAEIARAISRDLKKEPDLDRGLFVWQGIVTGQGDYSQNDQETVSILSLGVKISSYLGFDG
jgi:hypothetical protein